MKATDLRERFENMLRLEADDPLSEKLHGFPPETRQQKEKSELRAIISDIIIYLSDLEKRPPAYVPEPRLGPQPESEDQAVERGNALAEIVKEAERQLVESGDKEPKLCTTSGKPIDEHTREINSATGMQKDYVILCAEERAKGFVRPYRDTYTHLTCGTNTTAGRSLSETYARDPSFYSGTFCYKCRAHFPLNEFKWLDGETLGT